jgi:hypothetical protein
MPKPILSYHPPVERTRSTRAGISLGCGILAVLLPIVGQGVRVAQPVIYPSNRPLLAIALLSAAICIVGLLSAGAHLLKHRTGHIRTIVGLVLTLIGILYPIGIFRDALRGY